MPKMRWTTGPVCGSGVSLRRRLPSAALAGFGCEPGTFKSQNRSSTGRAVAADRGNAGEDAECRYGQAIDTFIQFGRKVEADAGDPDRVAAVVERVLTTKQPRARYLVGADARGGGIEQDRAHPDHGHAAVSHHRPAPAGMGAVKGRQRAFALLQRQIADGTRLARSVGETTGFPLDRQVNRVAAGAYRACGAQRRQCRASEVI